MSSLNTSLTMATQSLLAQELELQVTNNNIANANTAGYTRETVSLTEADPIQSGSISIGNGVNVQGIQAVRDELLTLRIHQQTSQQSSADAQVNALTQIQTLFPSTGSSLASSLSFFFTSMSALSSNPMSTPNRQIAISSAQTLVQQFNNLSSSMTALGSSLDTTLRTDVVQINRLSQQAAGLNQQLVQQQAAGQGTGPISDQLNQVEVQLAKLTNLSVTHTKQGDSLTTGSGTALVLGDQSYSLGTATDAGGRLQVVNSYGTNLTSTISGGDLGGTLQVRDTDIPALGNALDTLASQFANAFNTAQALGYDGNGAAGKAIFNLPSTVSGSAALISLATTDPLAIAASSDGSSGSNGNVANLTALERSTLPSGQSVTTMSSNLVYQIGNLTAKSIAQSSSIKLSLTALTNQQGSISGVSIDEESANLIRFQQAYQAAAKVVSTIQTLFDTTIRMIS